MPEQRRVSRDASGGNLSGSFRSNDLSFSGSERSRPGREPSAARVVSGPSLIAAESSAAAPRVQRRPSREPSEQRVEPQKQQPKKREPSEHHTTRVTREPSESKPTTSQQERRSIQKPKLGKDPSVGGANAPKRSNAHSSFPLKTKKQASIDAPNTRSIPRDPSNNTTATQYSYVPGDASGIHFASSSVAWSGRSRAAGTATLVSDIPEDSAVSSPAPTPATTLPRPSLIQQRKTTGSSSRSSIIQFRTIAEDVTVDGSFFNLVDRTIHREESFREVPESSIVSYAAKQSTIPMALDNVEFFQGDDGYRIVLDDLEANIQLLEDDGRKDWNQARSELSWLGTFWRWFVRVFLVWTNDNINRLRFTRGLQDWLPFQTSYESLILGNVIRSWDQDSRRQDGMFLRLAFGNRNVSRAMMRNLPRYDRLWHWCTQVTWNGLFDLASQFPLLGFLSFAATENFPSTKSFAIRALLRAMGAEGQWITRAVTGNLQALVNHEAQTPAQNLAAESNDFEQLNRDQYGTYVGRRKTNAFRLEHRLPTDESIVRTFMADPASTMVNNGVEHVLRCLAKHWHNMLYQENGNFAHQRMEQLDPFEVLRFHMPVVLVTLSNLRGRNNFDNQKLGPLIRQLQEFNPAKEALRYQSHLNQEGDEEMATNSEEEDTKAIKGTCAAARRFIRLVKEEVAYSVCAGIPSRLLPFQDWLDAIREAVSEIEEEAFQVAKLVQSVEKGIRLGYRLLKVVDWNHASDTDLQRAVVEYIRSSKDSSKAPAICIVRAMERLAPKDSRTLKELVLHNMANTTPARLLLGRTVTLLKRELWRKALDDRISGLSRGGPVTPDSLVKNKWYWVGQTNKDTSEKEWRVCLFSQRSRASKRLRFVDVDINLPVTFDSNSTEIMMYIPLAEAISRAQKVFMTLELDHGKKFTYNAFMEFGDPASEKSLRTRLRRLATVAQMQSFELDKARLNTLTEMKKTAKPRPDRKPQNVIVVGGGPTGLLAAVHCLQSVLMSGGEVKIYEDRDAFEKEAATYERAQIVRLDSRQMAMLRYHLGTSFEDIFIPASGETDPHLGNTIPSQGFVEVTIKRLEYMLQEEVLRLYSKDLLRFFSKARIMVDSDEGTAKKVGKSLKLDDMVYLEGRQGTWKVKEFVFEERLRKEDLVLGDEYDIRPRGDEKVRRFKLDTMDLELDHFHFCSQEAKLEDVAGRFEDLSPIYPGGKGRVDPNGVVFERASYGGNEVPQLELIRYDEVAGKEYRLNVTDSHILVAAGKPKEAALKSRDLVVGRKYDLISPDDGMPRRFELVQTDGKNFDFRALETGVSDVFGSLSELPPIYPAGSTHFHVTTEEPYAVCCIEGLKISMGMHNLGQQRWGAGIIDDIRSVADQNTRIVGDFTKSVALVSIVESMISKLKDDTVWALHFDRVAQSYGERMPNIASRLLKDVEAMKDKGFRRSRLQCRFFELGDNYYKGMEFAREFDQMKNETVKKLVAQPRENALPEVKKRRLHLREALKRSLDRLWYEASLEIISLGDVYNPGGRSNIPRLYTIDSPLDQCLHELGECEAFRLAPGPYVICGVDGGITKVRLENGQKEFPLPNSTPVHDADRGTNTTLRQLTMHDRFEPLATFEILVKAPGHCVVRNTAGYVVKIPSNTKVNRISDLSRGPDGYSESKVALASFPVAHVVCNRALKLNVKSTTSLEGFIMAFVGDGQASPHFMRYSGLTGACINCMSFNNMIAQAVAGIDFKARVQRYALETNWSNGEVVQRGTGANYGQDGFLRPGFTYTHLIDYLFEKAAEYDETETELSILSRDWKVKIAASLVPRGLENDSLFLSALVRELRKVLQQKFEEKLSLELQVDNLNPARVTLELDQFIRHWEHVTTFASAPFVDRFSSKTSRHIKGVVDALTEAIKCSVELRADNKRFSSELFTQPKPVDSIVDDFAVEAQNFANSLTQSVAFGVTAIALSLLDDMVGDIASLIFGIFSIAFAFGTMTNVSRYKNRNEEARRLFATEKLVQVQKAVFALLRQDQRDHLAPNEDPFLTDLQRKVRQFEAGAKYYGYSEDKVKPFKDAYYVSQSTINDDDGAAARFMRRIVDEYIPVTFHANSYLQEELVTIYKACNEIRFSRSLGRGEVAASGSIEKVLKMLLAFRGKLEASLESEQIRYGFFKRRSVDQWALIVTIRYFMSFVLPTSLFQTIGNETKIILHEMMQIRPPPGGHHEQNLRRAQIDVRQLYYATTESEVSSAVFLSGALVFTASIVFTIFRIISFAVPVVSEDDFAWVDILLTIASFAALLSLFGALLALLHFFRKTKHLVRLHSLLGQQRSNNPEVGHIRWVTFCQILLTLLRVFTNITAAAALPWFLYTSLFDEGSSHLPAYLAVISVLLALYSILFFFFVEFWVRYRLDPALGRRIFDLLKPTIVEIKQSLGKPNHYNAVETYETLERETWEYTSIEFLHRFRFDTVFAADRFGSILQYLQSQYLMDDNKKGQ